MKLINSNMLAKETHSLDGVEAIDWYTASLLSETPDLDERSQAVWFSLILMLSVAQRQGHTCLDLLAVAGKPAYCLNNDEAKWPLPTVNELQRICQEACSQIPGEVILLEDTRLYTRRYWSFENELATAICQRHNQQNLTQQQYDVLQQIWPSLFPHQLQSEDWQQVATAASLILPFCIINGGPGTGKTYTVARILFALQCMAGGGLTIQLAAPTGKAAQRLGESISQSIEALKSQQLAEWIPSIPTQAVTVHRLLGVSPYEVKTRKNQHNPIDCDVLIVDESSMVDLALMVRLVRALKPDCKLILVGDADQLPAIESGNVLEALVADQQSANQVNAATYAHIMKLNSTLSLPISQLEEQPFTFTLQKAQRFKGELADMAKLIQCGDSSGAWQQLVTVSPAQHEQVFESQSVLRIPPADFLLKLPILIEQSFGHLFTAASAADALSAAQFCRWLTPVKKGPFGVDRLNQQIEQIARQRAVKTDFTTSVQSLRFYSGQPIMVLENNYANKLYNGDVGVVWPDQNGNLKAWFETETKSLRAVSLARLPAVQTAYAMTVHKSQGSEFSHVVLMLPKAASEQQLSLNCRELLYTGLTRAKQSCIFICEQDVFVQTVQTRQQRFSGLSEQIKKKINKTKETA